jgi:hypothetical protein
LIDALEVLLRVDDEGLEIPQDLLLVVGEALLRVLRHVDLEELVQGLGFRGEGLHCFGSAALYEASCVVVVGNLQNWGSSVSDTTCKVLLDQISLPGN